MKTPKVTLKNIFVTENDGNEKLLSVIRDKSYLFGLIKIKKTIITRYNSNITTNKVKLFNSLYFNFQTVPNLMFISVGVDIEDIEYIYASQGIFCIRYFKKKNLVREFIYDNSGKSTTYINYGKDGYPKQILNNSVGKKTTIYTAKNDNFCLRSTDNRINIILIKINGIFKLGTLKIDNNTTRYAYDKYGNIEKVTTYDSKTNNITVYRIENMIGEE